MARPEKQKLDYFPLDVDFFQDEKIAAISGEFGLKGESIFIHLLCAIYRNSYFIEWTDLLRMKLLRELPGVTPELLDKVVDRLVKWGTFDNGLFSTTRVLTSTAIQKRYFNIAKRRANADLKYVLDSVIVDKNPVNVCNNSVIVDKNPLKKRKEKKIISSCMTEAYKREEERIFYEIFFWRNLVQPQAEVRRFVDYNAKTSWSVLNTPQKRIDAAMAWNPQQQGERCSAKFLAMWHKVFQKMGKVNPAIAQRMTAEGTRCAAVNGMTVIYADYDVMRYFSSLKDELPEEFIEWTKHPIRFASL